MGSQALVAALVAAQASMFPASAKSMFDCKGVVF
jgi:hypothetical protein